MAITDGIGDLVSWWRVELTSLLAVVRKRNAETGSTDRTIIRLNARSIAIERPAKDGFAPLEIDVSDASEVTDALSGPARRVGIELVLEPGSYLERPLATFRLPVSRLRAMAALDLSLTPLDPEGVAIFFERRSVSSADNSCYVIKDVRLRPLLEAVDESGCSLDRIRASTDRGYVEIDPTDLPRRSPKARGRTTIRRFNSIAFAGVALALSATLAHTHWRTSSGEAVIDHAIADLNEEVKAVRRIEADRKTRIDRLERLRRDREEAVPVSRLLEELSEVLPDTAWVSDFSTDGSTATITGYADAAAPLLAILENSLLFQRPAFTSSVIRTPGTDAERFTIRMEIER